MNKKNLSKKNYIDLLDPYSTECFWHIVSKIKDHDKKIEFSELKLSALHILEYMLENKIVFIIEKITQDKRIIRDKRTTNEVLKYIDKSWNEETEFIDLYNLAWLGFENWYKNDLIKIGLKETINWKHFVKNNIGDLMNWINENKP